MTEVKIQKTLEELVQFSHSVMSISLQPRGVQHARLPCPSPTPRACSNSCPSSQWCHPTISSSVIPFSSCLQSFPAEAEAPILWPPDAKKWLIGKVYLTWKEIKFSLEHLVSTLMHEELESCLHSYNCYNKFAGTHWLPITQIMHFLAFLEVKSSNSVLWSLRQGAWLIYLVQKFLPGKISN